MASEVAPMRSTPIRRWLSLVGSALLVSSLLVASQTPATAEPPVCSPPVPSETQPGYLIVDPDCDLSGAPFVPLTDAAGQPLSEVFTGIRDGASFRVEVPLNWNGDLVLFAHGFRGTGTVVWVDSPSLRAYYVSRGFAWAASSYQTNGYDVGQGVSDSHALIDQFTDSTGRNADRVFMTGVSMGGHVTAVAIEHFPRSFAGAMPVCGVLGDAELFDFFLDANVTAAALAQVPITFPLQPPPEFIPAYGQTVRTQILPALGTGWGTGAPPTLNEAGQRWAGVVEQRSGGVRPGFAAAFGFWNSIPSIAPLNTVPFLFGLYPGLSGGTLNIADGNVTSNKLTLYQMDDDFRLSPAELRLNLDVLRVSRTAKPSRHLDGVPLVEGKPRMPVLSMHDIGDLFVPFSMEQVYAARALLHGRSRNLVSRAIRAIGHCDFTAGELRQGFDDLINWVDTGQRPAGDDILDRRKVAEPTFGCQFTQSTRAGYTACP
jgi:pimeloyl-ACP methyl ester carboxylesterase